MSISRPGWHSRRLNEASSSEKIASNKINPKYNPSLSVTNKNANTTNIKDQTKNQYKERNKTRNMSEKKEINEYFLGNKEQNITTNNTNSNSNNNNNNNNNNYNNSNNRKTLQHGVVPKPSKLWYKVKESDDDGNRNNNATSSASFSSASRKRMDAMTDREWEEVRRRFSLLLMPGRTVLEAATPSNSLSSLTSTVQMSVRPPPPPDYIQKRVASVLGNHYND